MKLNTTKTMCLGCVGYAGRWGLWNGVLMAILASSSLAKAATLTVTAQVQDATCDISIPQAGTLMLGRFIADDFSRHGGTATTAAFQVKVESCSGTSTAPPALKVYGTTLSGNSHVFNSSSDGTAGFMVRAEKFSGPLAQFYSTTESVANGSDSYIGSESLIKDGVLDYTVGFVAPELALGGGGQAPVVGDISARLTFEFYYR